MKAHARQRGVALLAALLVVVAGMAAVLLSAFSTSGVQRAREARTHALLAQASEALVGFAATHGRLPRPAVAAGDSEAAGRERVPPCTSEAACTGLLPWLDLGLPATDSWGHALRYSVTPAFTVAPIQRTSAIATKRVLSRDASGALFFTAGQDLCSLPAQCAPAIVLSRGNGEAPGSEDEAANLSAALYFMLRPATSESSTPGGAFDDLLVAVPLQTLYERMAAAKTLP